MEGTWIPWKGGELVNSMEGTWIQPSQGWAQALPLGVGGPKAAPDGKSWAGTLCIKCNSTTIGNPSLFKTMILHFQLPHIF